MADHSAAAQRASGIRRVLVITLLLNVLVALLKLAYGTLTHTLSVRADGFHSLTDGFNNLLGLVGISLALRPPDPGHPYGHEKIEVLAGSVVGASLLLVAWDVVRGALGRLGGATQEPAPTLGTWMILALTLAVNLAVANYEARKSRELGSPFLESDATHTYSDILVTCGVLGTVGFLELGWLWMDWVAACAIGVFILVTGVRVLRRNFNYLMDAAQVDAQTVQDIVCRVPGVAGAHKIRTRGLPGAIRIDLHIQIARHLDVVQAHEVTHWAIDAVKRQVAGVHDVIVHTEPAAEGLPYPELPPHMRRPS